MPTPSSRPYTPRDLDAALALLAAWRAVESGDRLDAYPTLRRFDLLLTPARTPAALANAIWACYTAMAPRDAQCA